MIGLVNMNVTSFMLLMLISVSAVATSGFSLYLNDGVLHGPGGLGTHRLQNGSIQNFVVTAPLAGNVMMFNNGDALPNIKAETLHVTQVDGKLSDGTPINENVDVGFVLDILEPETQERVKLFVCSISGETVTPDDRGNIIFALTAGFDPGLPEFVVNMQVEFVTGVATVPLSEKTLRQEPGGADRAGIFPSGYSRVGRLGDFDNDGMLDGVFILGGHAPYSLIIAEGDPILVVRPFTSDIPVGAEDASLYALRGIIENYPEVLAQAVKARADSWLADYFIDIDERLDAIHNTIRRIHVAPRTFSADATYLNGQHRKNKKQMLESLALARSDIRLAREYIEKDLYQKSSMPITRFFKHMKIIKNKLHST